MQIIFFPSWQDNMQNALSVQHPINAIIYNSLEIDNAYKLLSFEPAANCLRSNWKWNNVSKILNSSL